VDGFGEYLLDGLRSVLLDDFGNDGGAGSVRPGLGLVLAVLGDSVLLELLDGSIGGGVGLDGGFRVGLDADVAR
jgi:hypothetical protein